MKNRYQLLPKAKVDSVKIIKYTCNTWLSCECTTGPNTMKKKKKAKNILYSYML